MNCIFRVLFMSEVLWLQFGSFGALCKFRLFKIFESLLPPLFSSNSTKLYGKCGNHGGMQVIASFVDLPNFKNFMELFLKFVLISKRYFSYSFHPMSAKFVRTLATTAEYRIFITFRAIGQVWKKCGTLKFLHVTGPMGKSQNLQYLENSWS